MSVAVVQASAWYPPFQMGGTEVYLEGLIEELGGLGIDSAVVVPRPSGAPQAYIHGGAPVSTYPPLASSGDFSAFEALLSAYPGAIYHQHSWTPDCGAEHLAVARRLGMPTVLTIHVASGICLTGTMMRFGSEPCDGRIDPAQCAPCWAQSRGTSHSLAKVLGRLPELPMTPPGKLGTALSARTLVRRRKDDFAAMIAEADRIVVVCEWLHAAMTANAAPAEKLVRSRQGLSHSFLQTVVRARRDVGEAGPLRLLYLGRWHPVKGIDVVVRALRDRPQLDVSLAIHAVDGGEEERIYRLAVEALIADDPRIVVGGPLKHADVAQTLAEANILVVPSTWLETGPMVALEAMAVGTFVLGSNVGGLAEIVDTPEKGTLVEAGDSDAWGRAIAAMVDCPPPQITHSVRTMAEAAVDMANLYAGLR